MGVLLAEPLLSGQVQQAHALGVGVVVQVGVLDGPGDGVGAHACVVVVGGLVVGLLESFGAGYVSSAYKDAIAFLVILAVLFAMPQGLFGRGAIERV